MAKGQRLLIVKKLKTIDGWLEFVNQELISEQSEGASEKKRQLLAMPIGCERPSQDTSLGSCLCNYTRTSGDTYDLEFDAAIRARQPQWFVSQSEGAKEKRCQLLAMPIGCNRPTGILGRRLSAYTRKPKNGHRSCYNSDFDSIIRAKQPQWFDKVAWIKQQILSLSVDAPCPKRQSDLALALQRYANPNSKQYDKKFSIAVRQRFPYWFISRGEKTRAILLEWIKNNQRLPNINGEKEERRLHFRYAAHRKNKNFLEQVLAVLPPKIVFDISDVCAFIEKNLRVPHVKENDLYSVYHARIYVGKSINNQLYHRDKKLVDKAMQLAETKAIKEIRTFLLDQEIPPSHLSDDDYERTLAGWFSFLRKKHDWMDKYAKRKEHQFYSVFLRFKKQYNEEVNFGDFIKALPQNGAGAVVKINERVPGILGNLRWRNGRQEISEKIWNEHYSNALKFYEEHGHSNFPNKSRLNYWAGDQRQKYRNAELNAEQIKLLQKIEFAFGSVKIDRVASSWPAFDPKLEELKKHIQTNGSLPSQRSKLGNFVTAIRRSHKDGHLGETRTKSLLNIGFSFDPLEDEWDEKYKHYFDHVQRSDKIPDHLKQWARNQRDDLTDSKLSNRRRQLLEQKGFDFIGSRHRKYEEMKCKYEECICTMEKFASENGHCKIPKRHPILGTFVLELRLWHKGLVKGHGRHKKDPNALKSHLSEEQIARINTLGFEWVSLYYRKNRKLC